MRTKPITAYRYELLPGGRDIVLRFDGLLGLDHAPGRASSEGLGGLTTWLEEWARRWPSHGRPWSEPGRARWDVWTFGRDYASYGVGGGDTTVELFVAVYDLFRVDADHPFRGWPDGWLLVRVGPNPALRLPTVFAFVPDEAALPLGEHLEAEPKRTGSPDLPERRPTAITAHVERVREAR